MFFKGIVHSLLAHFGYGLYRIADTTLDLQNEIHDPREAPYITDIYQPFVINAPLSDGRGLCWYSLVGGLHPFVLAVQSGLASQDTFMAIESVLTYYNQYLQPKDALDIQGINEYDAPYIKSQIPLVGAWLFPWGPRIDNFDRYLKNRISEYIKENQQWGLSKRHEADIFYGLGPVSKDKIQMEAKRLHVLIQSIQQVGYNNNYGNIGATVLISENKWRWLVSSGEHRAAVLAGLGRETVPIKILRIVNRQDVDFWPNVSSSIYTREGALKVFDRLFDAQLREVDIDWSRLISKELSGKPRFFPEQQAR